MNGDPAIHTRGREPERLIVQKLFYTFFNLLGTIFTTGQTNLLKAYVFLMKVVRLDTRVQLHLRFNHRFCEK